MTDDIKPVAWFCKSRSGIGILEFQPFPGAEPLVTRAALDAAVADAVFNGIDCRLCRHHTVRGCYSTVQCVNADQFLSSFYQVRLWKEDLTRSTDTLKTEPEFNVEDPDH